MNTPTNPPPRVRAFAACTDCFYEVLFQDNHILSIRYYPDTTSPRSYEKSWHDIPIGHQIVILQTMEKRQ
jgi:hypothetical protein